MYYKDNVESLILTIPKIPKILTFFLIILLISLFFLFQLKIYDFEDVYAIKYKENNYLEVVTNYENTEKILDYEYLEINKNKNKIKKIEVLYPKIEQIYENSYNIISIKLDDYSNIKEDIIIKVRLLKNKQSIFKKIFL